MTFYDTHKPLLLNSIENKFTAKVIVWTRWMNNNGARPAITWLSLKIMFWGGREKPFTISSISTAQAETWQPLGQKRGIGLWPTTSKQVVHFVCCACFVWRCTTTVFASRTIQVRWELLCDATFPCCFFTGGSSQDVVSRQGFMNLLEMGLKLRPGGMVFGGPTCSLFVFCSSSLHLRLELSRSWVHFHNLPHRHFENMVCKM